ncbi:hypothetical protein BT93_A0788 [Corymbia citriodora subsp. variegata]|nr:hypothetical protein BT93_A0788 [Corymbia citriodora subsp. variegata]
MGLYEASSENVTFHYVGLDKPEKPLIYSWMSNRADKQPPHRRASVVVRFREQTHELIVDLSSSPPSIVSKEVYHGHGFPILTLEEQTVAGDLPRTHDEFIRSIEKRGLDMSDVVCSTYSVGWYGEPRSRRVVKVLAYYTNGTVNFYMRPIEGIPMVVDLELMKIVKYHDRFKTSMPTAEDTEYRLEKQDSPFGSHLNGAAIVQPHGPGFEIKGHTTRFSQFGNINCVKVISNFCHLGSCYQTNRQVGLTGLLEVKAVNYTHASQITEDEYGTMVGANTIATHHDHFLTYHLDLDVDGAPNSFVKTNLITKPVAEEGMPRKSYWTVSSKTARTESEAQLHLGLEPCDLLVVNPDKRTKVGNNVGYRLIPGPIASPILFRDDYPQFRAAFTDNNLWVTPCDERKMGRRPIRRSKPRG